MSKKYDLAVYIGRFQPFHNGHKQVIEKGLEIANEVAVLVGSANASKSIKNPFYASEREDMIIGCFMDDSVSTIPLDDFTYEENQWITEVQEIVSEFEASKVCLIGHNKDETSYYLKNFPQWDIIETEYFDVIDSTQIRQLLFEGRPTFVKGAVPETVYSGLLNWMKSEQYSELLEEFKYIERYKRLWSGTPYPNTFNTVDAVVIQSGHILLIKRGEMPGRGLWALPGGFLNANETLINSCIRELREETKLKVPEPVLRGSIKSSKTFDAINRSTRGRTITHAFLIQLDDSQPLPKVKGADDAKEAHWIPLSDFYTMACGMYEDHYHIIRKLMDNT